MIGSDTDRTSGSRSHHARQAAGSEAAHSRESRAEAAAITGVGLGLRPELAAMLLGAHGRSDAGPDAGATRVRFVEVVAEACMANPLARREALAATALWPVVPHGVKLSLGSADGIREDHAARLGSLARELRAPLVSEHVAFTRSGTRDIGHLTRVPYTHAALRVLARNVARARRHLPDVPLLLENAAATVVWPEDELDEPGFYAALVRATGCPLLLDVGNLYANAVNAGRDPEAELSAFPLDAVAMFHIAGGAWEHGFYFDTHADPIIEPVFALLATALRHTGPRPILLERDDRFDDPAGLSAELWRLATMHDAAGPARERTTPAAAAVADGGGDDAQLAADQHALALALTEVEPPHGAIAARFGDDALQRTRTILARKRIDDALPHLPQLARVAAAVRPHAEAALAGTARAERFASLSDAWRIVERARTDASLRDAAALDGLLLRARFRAPAADGALRPRATPFVGRTRAHGRVAWAFKGPGRSATVHLVHPQPRSRT
ncbi:MAG: DUF692 domain-containing protein [Nannocystaceae bacterium]|nr:DUF692 domain-containing protein [Nannocystaceae bacterium]